VKFTLQDWHDRYQQQASWTAFIRSYLMGKINLLHSDRILEIGCGTGVITNELAQSSKGIIFGADIDFERILFAKIASSNSYYLCGDGFHLPFSDNTFSMVCCHYFLLWLKDQKAAIQEMARVAKHEGFIIIFAEPDHSSRIDYPNFFNKYGKLQTKALIKQGIDPSTGRKIGSLLSDSGLTNIEMGLLQWHLNNKDLENEQMEWKVAAEDTEPFLGKIQLKKYLRAERTALNKSTRIRIIPTFYAIGKVNKQPLIIRMDCQKPKT
jgi:ubiquinone/menaquinone biosynthesis C-methylase UbiE